MKAPLFEQSMEGELAPAGARLYQSMPKHFSMREGEDFSVEAGQTVEILRKSDNLIRADRYLALEPSRLPGPLVFRLVLDEPLADRIQEATARQAYGLANRLLASSLFLAVLAGMVGLASYETYLSTSPLAALLTFVIGFVLIAGAAAYLAAEWLPVWMRLGSKES